MISSSPRTEGLTFLAITMRRVSRISLKESRLTDGGECLLNQCFGNPDSLTTHPCDTIAEIVDEALFFGAFTISRIGNFSGEFVFVPSQSRHPGLM